MSITGTDICASKHGGNLQSSKANDRNMRHRQEQRMRVLDLITDAGSTGMSMKEVAHAMDTQFSSVSGRGTELKRLGMVEDSGEVRAGSAVLVATGTVKMPQPKEPEKPKEDIKAITPTDAQRQFKALEDLYENTAMSNEDYDNAKARIYRALGLWGMGQ